jgi:hypothetical protein
MKQQFRFLYALLLIIGTSFSLVSCKEDTVGPGETGDKPVIASFNASPGAIDIGNSTTLSWAVTGATSITIDSGLGDVTNASQLTIFPSETATYTLKAKNDVGEVTKSVIVTVNNPSDPGAPNNPKALVATAGNPGIIGLSWTASTGSTLYLIERRGAGEFAQIKTVTINSHTDAGLYPGVEYTYRVRAINGAGARSGWSNFARAIAPGTAPVVARVEVTPSHPTTLLPEETVQLTAKAYDAQNNNLNLAQEIFTWTSSSVLNATVTQSGLVTAGTAQGTAQVTASVGGKTSNSANITVALQQNPTLVIFNRKWTSEEANWAVYTSALGSAKYDVLHDRGANSTPTAITYEQIEKYERVIYISNDDNVLHASTRSLLKLYAAQANKRLILMGNSNQLATDPSTLALFGLKAEGWRNSNSCNSTWTGGAGTAMEGFNFEYTGEKPYFSEMVIADNNPATAAFSGSYVSNSKEFVGAVQRTLANGSKVFFAGFLLENVQQNLRDDFMTRIMAM